LNKIDFRIRILNLKSNIVYPLKSAILILNILERPTIQ